MRTTNPTLAALYRLKARLGKERAACDRMARESLASGDRMGARQCDVAASTYAIGMAFIDQEIARTKKGED